MRYLVVGTWRATGVEGSVFLECADDSEAWQRAAAEGLVADWVRPLTVKRVPSTDGGGAIDPWSGGEGGGAATAAAHLPPPRECSGAQGRTRQ
jgi:hypothetical protein